MTKMLTLLFLVSVLFSCEKETASLQVKSISVKDIPSSVLDTLASSSPLNVLYRENSFKMLNYLLTSDSKNFETYEVASPENSFLINYNQKEQILFMNFSSNVCSSFPYIFNGVTTDKVLYISKLLLNEDMILQLERELEVVKSTDPTYNETIEKYFNSKVCQ